MRTKSETISFYGTLQYPSLRASRVTAGRLSVWLPKRIVRAMRPIGSSPRKHEVVIPYWLAKKKSIF